MTSEPADNHRYKGTSPYRDRELDRKIFFGREREQRALASLVLAERLVVLFARSGMGKTSLVNAGVLPELRRRGYCPLVARVSGKPGDPMGSVLDDVAAAAERSGVDCVRGDRSSGPSFFRTAEFWSEEDDLLKPVLILDQFEEIFTLQTHRAREAFIGELAEMVRGRDGMAAPDLKVLIALREDFLAQLEQLRRQIPAILHNRFRLGPLDRAAARQAIIEPARLEAEEFDTATFSYQQEAVDRIIAFLGKERLGDEVIEKDEIEPFQLQLICQYLEEEVRRRQAAGEHEVEVRKDDLKGEGHMQKVLESFYDRTVRRLPRRLGGRVRRLCERRLISSSGRRLTEAEEQIELQFKIPPGRLRELVDVRLLRAEPRLGGTYYELSHDTMVQPILTSRRKRLFRRRLGVGLGVGMLLAVTAASLMVAFVLPRVLRSSDPALARPEPGKVSDEARQAGRTPDTFRPADEDVFFEMDGGAAAAGARRDVVLGRNAWMVWSAGNDRFWDHLARTTSGAVDLLKTLSSHPEAGVGRDRRFAELGLLNEPCFEAASGPRQDRYGLWLDVRSDACPPDPFENEEKYPGVAIGARGKNVPTGSYYGYASGVVGLRLFPNPDFDQQAAKRWDPLRYYVDPSYYRDRELVRPYRVGMSCAFCHAGFDPTNPPTDPERPAWSHLSPLVGNQFARFERIFLWQRDESNFVWQILAAAPPGTLDLSFYAADNVLNPATVGPLYALDWRLAAARRRAAETVGASGLPVPSGESAGTGPPHAETAGGRLVHTPRFFQDGSGSVGVAGALLRGYLKIGMFSEEWELHFNPLVGGGNGSPIEIWAARENSVYWQATAARTADLAAFLEAARRHPPLRDAPGGDGYLTSDDDVLTRGKEVFADRCAACHSSKLPEKAFADFLGRQECVGAGYLGCWNDYWRWTGSDEYRQAMRQLVLADDFLNGNYLSSDLRVPVTQLGTNACGSLGGSGAVGGLWDNFSSLSYKELSSPGAIRVRHPMTAELFEFELPGGGPGFKRTPSLLGLWASAPFLLANSLGASAEDPAIESRLAAFDQASQQLLWPELRPGTSYRTTADSYLQIAPALLPDALELVPGGALGTRQRITIGPLPTGLDLGLFGSLTTSPRDRMLGASLGQTQQLLGLTSRLIRDFKALPLDASAEQARAVVRPLVEPLLELSACPDFEVDRGHTFGSDLPDSDKLALIDFLKTL